MEKDIEIQYSYKKRRLTILQGGKVVGGYCGMLATKLMRKIAINNAEVEVKDGCVQIKL